MLFFRTMQKGMVSVAYLVLMTPALVVGTLEYEPRPEIGYPAGLIPECPGVMNNASISIRALEQLQIVSHRISNGIIERKPMPILRAAKMVAKDKLIDLKNKKTVLYAVGFLDSSVMPPSQAIGTAYASKGYNVFITETFTFLTYIYPKSVRLTRFIGKKIGEFLVQLTDQGLTPSNIELVGLSLGSHIVSYAAKYYQQATGRKVSRITGLDPAGPCFRTLSPKFRLNPSDAENVDVIHTNIDGFGIAERLGHMDVYVNGGEYQPGDIPYIPCLVVCSHLRAALYWWQALVHPKKFISVMCDSVQDARFARCYNSTVFNYLGLEADFNKPGVYYLGTKNEFPYYRGKAGLKEENEVYSSMVRTINAGEFEV